MEASAKKKLIVVSREGFRLLKTTRFLTFHKLKMPTMKRAPRPFFALVHELAEKELHLEAVVQEG